jgi:hypothetical protein
MAQGTHLLLLLLALACGPTALAAKVYRCGNSYSQTPCEGAVELAADDPRSPDQKAAADRAIADNARTAAAMEKARLQAEKRADQATALRKLDPERKEVSGRKNPSDRMAASEDKANDKAVGTASHHNSSGKAQRNKKSEQDKAKPFVAKSVVNK